MLARTSPRGSTTLTILQLLFFLVLVNAIALPQLRVVTVKTSLPTKQAANPTKSGKGISPSNTRKATKPINTAPVITKKPAATAIISAKPTAKSSPVTKALAALSPRQARCNETLTVQPGDTCFGIAADEGISVDSLRGANPGLNGECLIVVGQVLCLPTLGGNGAPGNNTGTPGNRTAAGSTPQGREESSFLASVACFFSGNCA
jgi:LysM repeat protein